MNKYILLFLVSAVLFLGCTPRNIISGKSCNLDQYDPDCGRVYFRLDGNFYEMGVNQDARTISSDGRVWYPIVVNPYPLN